MRRPDGWLAKSGPGWPERLGLDLRRGDDAALFGWWVACSLRASERRDEPVLAAVDALRRKGLLSAAALSRNPVRVAQGLDAAGVRKADVLAARLTRGAGALADRFEGSLSRLAGDAPSLEELGARLVSLGPGFGPGTALRFLRPLRDLWPAADEVPLDPAAHAAAVHLGWLDEMDDLETAPGTLRGRLDALDDATPLPLLEDALERLGRAACRRNDTRRCLLGSECPALR